jgi:hypothetical protein
MSGTDSMPVSLLGWRPLLKGSLCGFAKVRLGKSLVINDVAVLAGTDGPWASLPSKPVIGRDGAAQRDANGKQRYSPVLEWADRSASDRFSAAVVDAIRREHGDDALNGGAR